MTLSKLRCAGGVIVDEAGEDILLRGAGIGMWHLPEGYMFGSLPAPYDSPRGLFRLTCELIGPEASQAFWQQWREQCYTAADAKAIAEAGCNSVRLALDWQHLFTDEDMPQPIEEGLALIDRAIAFSKEAGLWVILDLHAAPGGQNGTNIDNGWGWPWLWDSPRCWQQTISIWRQLAERFRTEPAVAGYDLLNEPLPEAYQEQYYHKLPELYREIIAAIRTVDKETIIILEGANWSTDYSMITEKLDDQLVYGFHKYWNETDTASIQHYLDLREHDGAPLWCGETGENEIAWCRETGALLTEHNIGWNVWPYKRMIKDRARPGTPPYTIKRPEGWDEIVAYAKTGAWDDRPSLDVSRQAFVDLLENCMLENCAVNTAVLDAWFGR